MKIIKYFLLPAVAVLLNSLKPQLLCAQSLQGQALADSLLAELPNVKHDTGKAMLYYKLSKVVVSIDPEQAMEYANKCMSLSQKNKFVKGIGFAYTDMARVWITKSDFAAGLENSNKAYDAFKTINWKQGMGDALLLTGINYERQGYYAKSIENNFAALKLYEEAGIKTNMPSVYNNLGTNYYRLEDYSKAIENYSKSLALHKEAGNKFNIALVLDNMASVYKDQGDYEKASVYNLQSIQIFEEIGVAALSGVYFNRGILMENQKNFTAAYEFYSKALAISKKFGIKSSIAYDYAGIAGLYLRLAKNETVKTRPASFNINKIALIEKARFYFAEALKYSKETGELPLMMDCTKGLSETESLRGNYNAALGYYKQSATYKDSIFNDENQKKIAALENERLTEVKDKEIQLLNKDKALQASAIKRQTITRNAILGVVSLAAIFTFFLIRSYNRRRKAIFSKEMQQTEMKALRAQMNPHFIFNSLHSINRYVLENDKDNASAYLSKFAKLMRLVLENSREQEVPLENDLAALELYMQLEALRFQNRFRYSIEIDPCIDKENTLIPPLMLQPFAENAIVHGLKDKEGGLIRINIRAENSDMIKCIVEDNGTGRDMLPEQEQQENRKRKSLGIKIMQERLNIINQLKKAKAAVHIFDIKDAENKPGGLRIELLLPMQMAF